VSENKGFDMKREGICLLVLLVAMLLIFKIVFYKDTIINSAKISFAIIWIMIIPGYAFMLHWREHLNFIERAVIGSCASAGMYGILSYYLGIIGIHVKYHIFILPVLFIVIGVFMSKELFLGKKNIPKEEQDNIKMME